MWQISSARSFSDTFWASLCFLRSNSFSLIRLSNFSDKSPLIFSMDNRLCFSSSNSSCNRLLSCFRSTSSCISLRFSSRFFESPSTCCILRSTMSLSRSWTSFSYFSFNNFCVSNSRSSSMILLSKVPIVSPSTALFSVSFVPPLFSTGNSLSKSSSRFSELRFLSCCSNSTFVTSSWITSLSGIGSTDSPGCSTTSTKYAISISHNSGTSEASSSFRAL